MQDDVYISSRFFSLRRTVENSNIVDVLRKMIRALEFRYHVNMGHNSRVVALEILEFFSRGSMSIALLSRYIKMSIYCVIKIAGVSRSPV